MRAPGFWYATEGREAALVTRTLLTPVSWLYGWAGARRLRRASPARAGAPVICVGNLTLGGAGKTPVAREILRRSRGRGAKAAVLLRGHGGSLAGPAVVDPTAHGPAEAGDEAVLHAGDGLTVVSRDRSAGAVAAVAAGAGLIVMDDGYQNPSLAQDLRIVVIDGEAGFGNGRVFPAGPLREPVRRGLARAHAAVVMIPHPDFAVRRGALVLDGFAGPVLTAWLEPAAPPPSGQLVAFAGIGRPQKFFDSLTRHGAELAEEVPFPDHHVWRERDLTGLARLAEERGARLITTEKDHVRLPPEWRDRVTAWPVRAVFADGAALDALLAPLLGAAEGTP